MASADRAGVMRRGVALLVAGAVFVTGCSASIDGREQGGAVQPTKTEPPTTAEISDLVRQSMQHSLDTKPDISQYRLRVLDVVLVKDAGNSYKGIATVRTHKGNEHDVSIDVTADGENMIWEASPGAFLFAAEDGTPGEARAPAPVSPAVPPPPRPVSTGGPNFLTQSGRALCAVTPDPTISRNGQDTVVCQGEFAQAPEPGAGAVTHGNGDLRWQVGNLAVANPTTNMTYGNTYRRGNWTIFHDSSGTRFTNNRTGHGMFVSIENVYAF